MDNNYASMGELVCVCVCEHGLTVNCRIGQGGKTRWPSICSHGYFVYFSAIANPSNALPLSITLSKTIQVCIHLPVSFKYQLKNVMVPTYLDTGQIWVGHVGQLQSYIYIYSVLMWFPNPILGYASWASTTYKGTHTMCQDSKKRSTGARNNLWIATGPLPPESFMAIQPAESDTPRLPSGNLT